MEKQYLMAGVILVESVLLLLMVLASVANRVMGRRFVKHSTEDAFRSYVGKIGDCTSDKVPKDPGSVPDLEKALEVALDVRKFEIDLYWKRATYFWGLMGFCFAGASFAGNLPNGKMAEFFLSCLGVLISVGFWLENKGSKFWQENWESQVDLLEEKVIGPVYRNVFITSGITKFGIASAWPFSVSRVNIILSGYFVAFWVLFSLWQIFQAVDANLWQLFGSWYPHIAFILELKLFWMMLLFCLAMIGVVVMIFHAETAEIGKMMREELSGRGKRYLYERYRWF